MKLKSIELINIRGFNKTEIEFSNSINILTGKNNSGKSTIISSILNLQNYSIRKEDIQNGQDYGRIYYHFSDIKSKDNLLLNAEFNSNLNENGLEFEEQQSLAFGVYSKNESNEDFYIYNSNSWHEKTIYEKINLVDEEGFKHDLSKKFKRFKDLENEGFFLIPFLSRRKGNYYDSQSNKVETNRINGDLRNFAARVLKITAPSHPQNPKYNDLCRQILGFIPGVISSDNSNQINLGIYTSQNSQIPIQSMGEGVVNILGLIVNSLMEDNKLFIIEELENDIHPEALKAMLHLIIEKSKKNQFIISTHSSLVLKLLGQNPDSKIFWLETEIPNETNNGFNLPVSKIKLVANNPNERRDILQKLGYDFFDFEFNHAFLILEESTVERLIREVLIPEFVPSLNNKLKTISAMGVNDIETKFSTYLSLFVYLHTDPKFQKKAWVVTDGDIAGKKITNELKLKFKNWDSRCFLNFEKENFEDYFPSKFKSEIELIKTSKNGLEKQKRKGKLLEDLIVYWYNNKPRVEFEICFKDHISILKNIELNLK